jgi:hypothetical protein
LACVQRGWAINETIQIDNGEACASTQTVQMDSLALALDEADDVWVIDISDDGDLEIPDGSVVTFSKALVSSLTLSTKPIKYTISCTSSCSPIDGVGTCASTGCQPFYPNNNKAPYCTTLVCNDKDYCSGSCTQSITAAPVSLSKK